MEEYKLPKKTIKKNWLAIVILYMLYQIYTLIFQSYHAFPKKVIGEQFIIKISSSWIPS